MVIKSVINALATCIILSNIHAATQQNAVKTIKSKEGDIYDCVDFYKQPALNHPLLKGHTFHPLMRPSYRPKASGKKLLSKNEPALDMIRLKDGGCPTGTVPITRLTSQQKTMQTHQQSQQHFGGDTSKLNGGVIIDKPTFAIGQTKSDPSKRYFGATGTISIHNPRADKDQYSSAQIIFKGGNDVLKAGWTVNPSMYKDNLTRFFIYTIAGNLSCFNSECGFVLVRSDIPLNFKLHPVSKPKGKKVYSYDFYVYQDKKNGNYWLEVSSWRLILGFWPQSIFAGLNNGGTYAACGGEVNSIATLPPPEMGAGIDPSLILDTNECSFCKHFAVLNESFEFVDADTEEYHNSDGYNCVDDHVGHDHIIYFGGPT